MAEIVVYTPKFYSMWNTSLWGSVKATIQCGRCGIVFKERIPIMTRPRVMCKCGSINEIPIQIL